MNNPMIIEIRVPEAGESITQVELAKWLVEDGEYVDKDQEIAEIDSDKATLTINADKSGVLKIIIEEGSTIEPGKIIGQIDTSAKKPSQPDKPEKEKSDKDSRDKEPEKKEPSSEEGEKEPKKDDKLSKSQEFTFTPQAKKVLEEQDISLDDILKNPDNKRITKKDVLVALSAKYGKGSAEPGGIYGQDVSENWGGTRNVQSVKMTTLRKKIAERLVAVKNQTAMLTTFNEVDMSAILALREKYKEKFLEKIWD
jgi:2-oxoglutarate dehydrogenase E2 component (dihydrolipoamide succinyltransferase)